MSIENAIINENATDKTEYINVAIFSSKSFNLLDILIKFFTRSKYTHAAVYLKDKNEFIEPAIRKAFVYSYWYYTPVSEHKNETVYIYKIPVTAEQKRDFLKFMNFIAQEKLIYNYLGVLGFVIPIFTSNGGYFCSEGVFNGLKYAGILKTDQQGWQVNPEQLRSYLEVIGGEVELVMNL